MFGVVCIQRSRVKIIISWCSKPNKQKSKLYIFNCNVMHLIIARGIKSSEEQ